MFEYFSLYITVIIKPYDNQHIGKQTLEQNYDWWTTLRATIDLHKQTNLYIKKLYIT